MNKWVDKLLVWFCLIVFGVFFLGPLIWLGIRAFAGDWVFPNLLPSSWTFHWWGTVFGDAGLGVSIGNSFSLSLIVVCVSMFVCLPAAFVIGRNNFWGKNFFLLTIFTTNAFPKMGLFVSMSTLFYSLNLMNSILGIVIVQLIGTIVFMTWIPAAAFGAVPRSLEEAARDAGAGWFRVFWNVTLRYALPGILVAIVMSFLASFDEAQGTYLVGAPKYFTMPTQMYTLVLNYPSQVAAVFSILLSIPSFVLMLLARRFIVGGQLAKGFILS